MTFQRLLAGLVDLCRRNALWVVLAGGFVAIFSAWYADRHLGINTDTDQMFAPSLPWRQRAELTREAHDISQRFPIQHRQPAGVTQM